MAASVARGSGRYARMVIGVGALALTAGFMAPAALAIQGVSQLLVSNTTTLTGGVTTDAVTLDVQGVDDPSSATVYVGLDSSCPNVFVDKSGHGQTYTMMSSFDVAGIASVNPSADVPNLNCTSVTPFAITAVSAGVTTLSFNPGATNHGLQKKVAG